MRPIVATLTMLLLPLLSAVPTATASGADAPCAAADKFILGGFQSDDELGCNGTAVCPDSPAATPCAFTLTVTISGTGVVEAAAFAQGSTQTCLGALTCTIEVPIATAANTNTAWACWGAVRTVALDATLTCTLA